MGNQEFNTDDKTKPKDEKSLPSKLFMKRNSLLTDLLENIHFRILYNIGAVLLIGMTINSVIYHHLAHGTINFGQVLIIGGFRKFDLVILTWIINFLSVLLCYPMFVLWAKVRCYLSPISQLRKIWDYSGVAATILYYFAVLLYIPCKITWENTFPVCSAMVSICESMRFTMKCHAFIRSNVPKILSFKPHSEKDLPLPVFSKFVYFLFVPTLVYQDHYPRTTSIRWRFVAKCFFEFFLALMFMSLVVENYFFESLWDICTTKMPWYELPLIAVRQSPMGLMLILLFFYLLLQSWMNAFAELTRFGDRLFYKDWWTSTSYQRFYRTWNNPVHDWLYTYLLKDCYEVVMPRNKTISRITVVLISAIFHEYMLIMAARIFFPLLFFCFLIPSIIFWMFKEPKHWIGNLFFLYCLGLGISLQVVFYAAEHLARENCPQEEKTWENIVVPRLLRCDCFT